MERERSQVRLRERALHADASEHVEADKQKEAKVAKKKVEEEKEGEGGGGDEWWLRRRGRWRSKGRQAKGRGRRRERESGRERQGRRVSSSCNAINPVAVHHVDTILVDSFQSARVVGVGFCAITSLARVLRVHANIGKEVHAGCTRGWPEREKKRERNPLPLVERASCEHISSRTRTDYARQKSHGRR